MLSRLPIVRLLVATALLSLVARAQNLTPDSPQFSRPGDAMGSAYVVGRVLDANGAPVPHVRVELEDLMSGVTIASAFSESNGDFEMRNIPSGSYQAIAVSDLGEARAPVMLQYPSTSIELRFNTPAPPNPADQATISVAQMQVPRRARRAFDKARVDFAVRKFDEALKQDNRALAIAPDFAEALTLRGLMAMRSHQFGAGETDLSRAIHVDPNYATAYLALGALYNAMHRFDDALRELDRVVTLEPTSWIAYFEIAKATVSKAQYEQGLKLLAKCEQFGGAGYPGYHLVRAAALLPLHRVNEGRGELQIYLNSNPTGPDADSARRVYARLEAQSPKVAQASEGR